MGDVVTLVMVAVVTIVIAPLIVRHGRWQSRAPRFALWAWLLLFTTGLVSVGGAVLIAVGTTAGLIPHLEDGHTVFDHTVLAVVAWGSLAILGGLAVVVAVRLERLEGSAHAIRDAAERCRRVAATPSGLAPDVTITETDRVFALAVPGPNPHILVSRGLVTALTADELAAVIEHERSHLVNCHSMIVTLAEINQACVPRLAAARAFGSALTVIVELVADDAAVRRCGASALSAALRVLDAAGESNSAALRADRLDRRRALSR